MAAFRWWLKADEYPARPTLARPKFDAITPPVHQVNPWLFLNNPKFYRIISWLFLITS
jgi:hypothetical protein